MTRVSTNKRSVLDERFLKCGVCGERFWDNSKLIKHMESHDGDKPLLCTICNKTFMRVEDLDKHYLLHRQLMQPYGCPACESRFVTQQQLMVHVDNIHPELTIGNETNSSVPSTSTQADSIKSSPKQDKNQIKIVSVQSISNIAASGQNKSPPKSVIELQLPLPISKKSILKKAATPAGNKRPLVWKDPVVSPEKRIRGDLTLQTVGAKRGLVIQPQEAMIPKRLKIVTSEAAISSRNPTVQTPQYKTVPVSAIKNMTPVRKTPITKTKLMQSVADLVNKQTPNKKKSLADTRKNLLNGLQITSVTGGPIRVSKVPKQPFIVYSPCKENTTTQNTNFSGEMKKNIKVYTRQPGMTFQGVLDKRVEQTVTAGNVTSNFDAVRLLPSTTISPCVTINIADKNKVQQQVSVFDMLAKDTVSTSKDQSTIQVIPIQPIPVVKNNDLKSAGGSKVVSIGNLPNIAKKLTVKSPSPIKAVNQQLPKLATVPHSLLVSSVQSTPMYSIASANNSAKTFGKKLTMSQKLATPTKNIVVNSPSPILAVNQQPAKLVNAPQSLLKSNVESSPTCQIVPVGKSAKTMKKKLTRSRKATSVKLLTAENVTCQSSVQSTPSCKIVPAGSSTKTMEKVLTRSRKATSVKPSTAVSDKLEDVAPQSSVQSSPTCKIVPDGLSTRTIEKKLTRSQKATSVKPSTEAVDESKCSTQLISEAEVHRDPELQCQPLRILLPSITLKRCSNVDILKHIDVREKTQIDDKSSVKGLEPVKTSDKEQANLKCAEAGGIKRSKRLQHAALRSYEEPAKSMCANDRKFKTRGKLLSFESRIVEKQPELKFAEASRNELQSSEINNSKENLQHANFHETNNVQELTNLKQEDKSNMKSCSKFPCTTKNIEKHVQSKSAKRSGIQTRGKLQSSKVNNEEEPKSLSVETGRVQSSETSSGGIETELKSPGNSGIATLRPSKLSIDEGQPQWKNANEVKKYRKLKSLKISHVREDVQSKSPEVGGVKTQKNVVSSKTNSVHEIQDISNIASNVEELLQTVEVPPKNVTTNTTHSRSKQLKKKLGVRGVKNTKQVAKDSVPEVCDTRVIGRKMSCRPTLKSCITNQPNESVSAVQRSRRSLKQSSVKKASANGLKNIITRAKRPKSTKKNAVRKKILKKVIEKEVEAMECGENNGNVIENSSSNQQIVSPLRPPGLLKASTPNNIRVVALTPEMMRKLKETVLKNSSSASPNHIRLVVPSEIISKIQNTAAKKQNSETPEPLLAVRGSFSTPTLLTKMAVSPTRSTLTPYMVPRLPTESHSTTSVSPGSHSVQIIRYNLEDMKRDQLRRKEELEKKKIYKKILEKFDEKEKKKQMKFCEKKLSRFISKHRQSHLVEIEERLLNVRNLSLESRVQLLKDVISSGCMECKQVIGSTLCNLGFGEEKELFDHDRALQGFIKLSTSKIKKKRKQAQKPSERKKLPVGRPRGRKKRSVGRPRLVTKPQLSSLKLVETSVQKESIPRKSLNTLSARESNMEKTSTSNIEGSPKMDKLNRRVKSPAANNLIGAKKRRPIGRPRLVTKSQSSSLKLVQTSLPKESRPRKSVNILSVKESNMEKTSISDIENSLKIEQLSLLNSGVKSYETSNTKVLLTKTDFAKRKGNPRKKVRDLSPVIGDPFADISIITEEKFVLECPWCQNPNCDGLHPENLLV